MVLWYLKQPKRAFPSIHSHIFGLPLSGYIRADGVAVVAGPVVEPGAVVGVVSFVPGTVVAFAPGVAEVVFSVDIVGALPVGAGVDPPVIESGPPSI